MADEQIVSSINNKRKGNKSEKTGKYNKASGFLQSQSFFDDAYGCIGRFACICTGGFVGGVK